MVEDAVTVNEVKGAVPLRVQLLPSDLARLDAGLVDRLQELHLPDEVEWLTRHHLRSSQQLEHEGVIPRVRTHIQDAFTSYVGNMRPKVAPALVVAPLAADHQVTPD